MALKAKDEYTSNADDTYFPYSSFDQGEIGISHSLPINGDYVPLSEIYEVVPQNLEPRPSHFPNNGGRNSISMIPEESEETEDENGLTTRSDNPDVRNPIPSFAAYGRSGSSNATLVPYQGRSYSRLPHPGDPDHQRLHRSSSQEKIDQLTRIVFTSEGMEDYNHLTAISSSDRRRSSSGSDTAKSLFNKTVEMFENLSRNKRSISSEGNHHIIINIIKNLSFTL